MSLDPCCTTGFSWDGKPTGHIGHLGSNDAYITGSNPDAAILIIHDLLGWTFPNVRLLADHYAAEARATVYVPDFFGGAIIPPEPIHAGRWREVDIPGFLAANSRAIREPEIFAAARALRSSYKKVAAVGFCYGGWAVFRLAAREHDPPLVDCVTAGHPSLLTVEDIEGVGGEVPVQVLAPEVDAAFTAELKMACFVTLQKLGMAFDYQHFPGVAHACLVRGDGEKVGEREAMARGKNAVVGWCRPFLHGE